MRISYAVSCLLPPLYRPVRTTSFPTRRSSVLQLLIVAVVGPGTIGYYNLAWLMSLQPLALLNPVVMRVAFPLFARIQHEQPRLRRGYFQAQRLLGAVNFPLFFGLAVLDRKSTRLNSSH